MMDMQAFERMRVKLSRGPIKCQALNSFCAPQLILCGPSFDDQKVASYIQVLADRAARIGVKYIGIGAPKSRSIPSDFSKKTAMEQFGRSLRIICQACAPYDITVLLEAVCSLECNFITTTDEAAAVIENLKLDNLQLVYDTYHAFMMGEDDAPLHRAMKHIKLVHVAQNIDGKRHYLRRENLAEYQVYFNALLEGGYDGEVSVEAFYDSIEEQLDETLDIMKILCSRSER